MSCLCLGLTPQQEAWLSQGLLLGFSGVAWALYSSPMFTCESTICFSVTCFYVVSYRNSIYFWLHITNFSSICWQTCRKLLQERNNGNSNNSFYFRIYILVVGVYAALRLAFAFLLKVPACHALSEMSDQSFFQFFKWIYQVSFLLFLFLFFYF